jgi:hypothetical protein
MRRKPYGTNSSGAEVTRNAATDKPNRGFLTLRIEEPLPKMRFNHPGNRPGPYGRWNAEPGRRTQLAFRNGFGASGMCAVGGGIVTSAAGYTLPLDAQIGLTGVVRTL